MSCWPCWGRSRTPSFVGSCRERDAPRHPHPGGATGRRGAAAAGAAPLPGRTGALPRRHGRGVPGPRHLPRPPGGPQGHPPRAGAHAGLPRALPARGAGPGAGDAQQRGAGLLRRRGRGHAVHGDGAGRRRFARRAPRAARLDPGADAHARAGARAPGGHPPRHRAPRHQALQRAARPLRAGPPRRLRAGGPGAQSGRSGLGAPRRRARHVWRAALLHHGGGDHGHAPVHVAGAGARPAARRPRRHLLAGRLLLRAAHRPAAQRGAQPRGAARLLRRPRPGPAGAAAPRPPPALHPRHRPLHGPRYRRALRDLG